MSKKAQAAMEFLMTYGWAILVVLGAIGALAYFGVLSPEKFLPEKCTIAPGIDCANFDIQTDEAIFALRNGMGRDVILETISVGDNCERTFTEEEGDFPNGELVKITISGCDNGDIGDRFKEDISIRYLDDMTDVSKLTDGSVVAKIQE